MAEVPQMDGILTWLGRDFIVTKVTVNNVSARDFEGRRGYKLVISLEAEHLQEGYVRRPDPDYSPDLI